MAWRRRPALPRPGGQALRPARRAGRAKEERPAVASRPWKQIILGGYTEQEPLEQDEPQPPPPPSSRLEVTEKPM